MSPRLHRPRVMARAPRNHRDASTWLVTLGATVASTYALDATATAVGLLLVASQLSAGLDHLTALALLVASYGLWGVGLRANLRANWSLLQRTATSTNVLAKAAFELTRRRSARAQRVAAATGYVAAEMGKEVAYYGGAFGAASLTDSVSTSDALLFLTGTNIGAAAYEYALARMTTALLDRAGPVRSRPAEAQPGWTPARRAGEAVSKPSPSA